ncbi:MAG: 16S rRNA (cytosine(967)-C(5))-methyltransferase RsmB [Ruminococcaceae bacterium]|nr:16S rRNA (cytosine(967)-C(5))-methyltransferase RsmB [Oscillospiraceae bacterium]
MAARETALNVLIAVRKEAAWSNGILKNYIQRDRLSPKDAALATRLCYGVLQNRALLDFYLAQLLTGRLKDLHPVLRDILHLGLYQIYKMDRIPDSAAVNESVQLAKKYCKFPKGAGLVNGVLRNAVRTAGQLKTPEGYAEKYSHPQELIDFLKPYVGKEHLPAMLEANNEIPPLTVQVNLKKTSREALMERLAQEGVDVRTHSVFPQCLVLENTGNIEQLPSFQDGLFYVQDAAAWLSVQCAEIREGDKVLDCCAAPGGKSFAAAICGAGEICSCDIHPHKVELLQKGAERLGFSNIHPQCRDATEFVPQWQDKMDVVIADVPCSGYGIIRKKPDIRYKLPTTMAELPALQAQILENQARYVKPGGTLLYSTCTLAYRENEGVVEAFLQAYPEFQLIKLPLPESIPQTREGMLTLIPGTYDTDGFFICRMRRKE